MGRSTLSPPFLCAVLARTKDTVSAVSIFKTLGILKLGIKVWIKGGDSEEGRAEMSQCSSCGAHAPEREGSPTNGVT